VISRKWGKNPTYDNNLKDHVKRIQSFLRMGLRTGSASWKITPFSPPEGQNITAEDAKIFLNKGRNQKNILTIPEALRPPRSLQ
jgi:hypothetical protein